MRVLYSSFHYKHQWKIAKYLQQKHQWEPVYWMSGDAMKADVEREFPNIVFQDYIKARRAIHSNNFADTPDPVLDKSLIEALAVNQITAMKIIYRCDTTGYTFSFNDLIEHYYEQVKFWLKVITELKIELLVCWTNIHSSEYVLYLLCKHFNIPVLYVDSAYCITKDTHLIANSVEDRTNLLRAKYNSNEIPPNPKPSTLERLARIRGDYKNAKPDYMSSPNIYGVKGQYLTKALRFTKEMLSIATRNPFKKTGIHFKFSKGSYKSEDTSGNRFQLFKYYRRVKSQGSHYKKIYEKFTTPFDPTVPYIYFASPYQPEGTTLPDAGVYDRIILILEMLSALTPKEWTIYYKEHPTTFDSLIGGDLYRSAEFYERVSKIPKIKMVNYSSDSFKLIDNSIAVASATGTVGWEGIVRGKPSLVFGQVWYLPCEGAFLVNSSEDCEKAIAKIKSGYAPDQQKILKFAGVVDKYCISNFKFIDYQFRLSEIKDIDEELARYSEAFYQAYNLYQELEKETV